MTPTQKKHIRAAIADYCLRAEKNQLVWHYSQQRPYTGLWKLPEYRHVNDCSGYVALVFHWAMHRAGVYLADPLGYAYSGWGYTGSEVAWLKQHAKPAPKDKYLVGDLVVYGLFNGSHTAVCRKAGTGQTAIWSSNGNENSPQPVKLHYHPDPIQGVWRHPGLA